MVDHLGKDSQGGNSLLAGIGLFEVDKKDHVRKYSDVDTISIFKFRHKRPGQPPAFLQCGGFIFPLVPGKSPILKSGGVYMFPELRSGEDGNRVGVSLESASKEQLAQLDGILSELADLRTTQEVKDQEVGVAKEEKGDANWGSTVAGVSVNHVISLLMSHEVYHSRV